MLFQRKLFGALFLFFNVMTLQAQQKYVRDENGRTELINYVIWQEVDIATIRKDIDRLWDVCYEKVTVCYGFQNTVTVTLRRASCMDSDIVALKDRNQDLKKCIETSVFKIWDMVSFLETSEIQAYDNQGKTALNYCQTYEIYKALISCGVPFQYTVWAYFNPSTVTLGLCGSVAFAALIVSMYNQHCYFSYTTAMPDIIAKNDIVQEAEIAPKSIAREAYDIIELMGLSY